MYLFPTNVDPVSQIGLQPTKMWEKMVQQGEIRLCSERGGRREIGLTSPSVAAASSGGGDGDKVPLRAMEMESLPSIFSSTFLPNIKSGSYC